MATYKPEKARAIIARLESDREYLVRHNEELEAKHKETLRMCENYIAQLRKVEEEFRDFKQKVYWGE